MNDQDLKNEVNILREYVSKTCPDMLDEITVPEIKRLSKLYNRNPWEIICETYNEIKINEA